MKWIVLMFTLLMPTFASAQTEQAAPAAEFQVIQGTTLWDLARQTRGNALLWESIFRTNVEAKLLEESDLTYTEDGEPTVWLAIGQRLLLAEGVAQTAPELITATAESVQTLPPTSAYPESSGSPWTPGMLVLAVLGAAGFVAGTLRKRARDVSFSDAVDDATPDFSVPLDLGQTPAVTMTDEIVRELASGRPFIRASRGPDFVPGGVRDSATLGLAAARAATIDYARAYPTRAIPRYETVWVRDGQLGNLVEGAFYTTFGDGSRGPDRIATRQNPIRVWRLISIMEGEEIISFVEVICGNGMGRGLGIGDEDVVFEADPAPAPYNVPEEMQPQVVAVGVHSDPLAIEVGQRGRLVSAPWTGEEMSYGDDGTMFVPGEDGVRRLSPGDEPELIPWRN